MQIVIIRLVPRQGEYEALTPKHLRSILGKPCISNILCSDFFFSTAIV